MLGDAAQPQRLCRAAALQHEWVPAIHRQPGLGGNVLQPRERLAQSRFAVAKNRGVVDASDAHPATLAPLVARGWSAATAYALLAWFVFARQCLATLAAVRREGDHRHGEFGSRMDALRITMADRWTTNWTHGSAQARR